MGLVQQIIIRNHIIRRTILTRKLSVTECQCFPQNSIILSPNPGSFNPNLHNPPHEDFGIISLNPKSYLKKSDLYFSKPKCIWKTETHHLFWIPITRCIIIPANFTKTRKHCAEKWQFLINNLRKSETQHCYCFPQSYFSFLIVKN